MIAELTTTDFDKFVHQLNTFDWYYAYQEGHRQHANIVNQSKQHPLLEEAYNAYIYNFSSAEVRLVRLTEIRSKI